MACACGHVHMQDCSPPTTCMPAGSATGHCYRCGKGSDDGMLRQCWMEPYRSKGCDHQAGGFHNIQHHRVQDCRVCVLWYVPACLVQRSTPARPPLSSSTGLALALQVDPCTQGLVCSSNEFNMFLLSLHNRAWFLWAVYVMPSLL